MSETATGTTVRAAAPQLREDYERDGYVVVPGIFSREECAQLKAEGLRVLKECARPGASVYVGAAVASETYRTLAADPRLVEVLKELMPNGVMFMSDKFVFKSGEKRFPTPWHQDAAYWPNTRPKLSIWIALDDVNESNGALKVFPGGHKKDWTHGEGVRETEGEFTNVIRDIPMDSPEALTCEMAMGDALFFSDLLPHASCSNESGEDRYAIISTYHDPAPDDSFDLMFEARHVIVPAPENV